MITSNFNHEKSILITTCIGDVTIDEIVDYAVEIKNKKQYPRNLKTLLDATKAKVKFDVSDISKIVDANNKTLEIYDCLIYALLIDSPMETAMAFIFKNLAINDNFKIRIFSTKSAALEWIYLN